MKLPLQHLSATTVTPNAVVTISVGATAVAVLFGDWSNPTVTSQSVDFALAAGVCLADAVIGYVRAFSTASVGVVVPMFGRCLLGGAVIAIVLWVER